MGLPSFALEESRIAFAGTVTAKMAITLTITIIIYTAMARTMQDTR